MNKTTICLIVVAVVAAAVSARGQGTIQITFDGPPLLALGTTDSIGHYEEAGLIFTRPFGALSRRGIDSGPEWPDNGSTYLQTPPELRFTNGSLFSLVALDLAEFSTEEPAAVTVQIVGFREDGSTVMTSFTTDGIIDGSGPAADFETFFFGPEFSNLSSAAIGFSSFMGSLDNLVVAVPEPSVVALFLIGGGLIAGLCARRRTRSIKQASR